MSTYTPGPWGIEIEKVKKRDWVIVYGATGVVCRTGATDMPGALGDARLIAAAPDLLEALAQCCQRLENIQGQQLLISRQLGGHVTFDAQDEIDLARTAIAKAGVA
jgi:hypothetical protein